MKTNRLLCLLLALAMLLSCTAFAEEPAGTADDPLLATVNSKEVRLSAVRDFYDYLVSYYADEGYDMTDENNLTVIRAWAMQGTVQNILIAQYAAAHGLDTFTEEEEKALQAQTDEQWSSMIDSYIEYYANDTGDGSVEARAQLEENAAAYYTSAGITYDICKQWNREEILQERVQAALCSGLTVSDEEIRAEYETRVADSMEFSTEATYYELYTYYFGYDLYVLPEGYRAVKQILLPADEDLMEEYIRLSALYEEQAVASAEDLESVEESSVEVVAWEQVEEARKAVLAASQATLDEIRAQLDAGTSFDELVAIYGTDELMKEEPFATRGMYVHQDSIMWSPTVIDAAFSVDTVGGVSEPAVDSDGIHIVRYEADVPGGPVELDEDLRAAIYESLLVSKESDAFQDAMDGMMAEADIVYTDAGKAYDFSLLMEEETGSAEAAQDPAAAPADTEVPASTAEPTPAPTQDKADSPAVTATAAPQGEEQPAPKPAFPLVPVIIAAAVCVIAAAAYVVLKNRKAATTKASDDDQQQ